MRFGRVALADALGAVVGHTLHLGAGGVLKKGTVIDERGIAALRAAGHEAVIAARLDEGDVPEDEAAFAVARASAGSGLRVAAAHTGRSNLHAEHDGLVEVDRERIDRLNLVDEAVTMATLPPHAAVRAGDMVATVKIIPYAVRAEALAACEAAVLGSAIRLRPFRPFRAGLVLTRLPGTNERALDRAAAAQRVRVERMGGAVAKELRCPHDEEAVATAIRALLDDGCAPLLLLGASAIADRRDVIPAAIERAGGLVEHFGMPVDPGNLLLLARRGATPIIGVPGCARSLKRSGFDLVLERLAAGLPVARADLMTLGVGGLLVEIAARPEPREAAPEAEREPEPHGHRVAAVVLAAGRSARMGARNKLTEAIDGKPMVSHVVDALLETPARPIVVVTGHEEEAVRRALADRDVRFAACADWATGMSASLRAGIEALMRSGEPLDGALVCLGDMPRLRPRHVEALLAGFDPAGAPPGEARPICVPTFERRRGNPVLFAARYFDELRALEGDVGARSLLSRHEAAVLRVEVGDDGVLLDVDTPEALRALGAESD